ncbi:MAG: hypothetical protein IT370_24680 [Deltaproteobacteria bacterium]|nr:hypothetical protein [Deltaproteobacteria bacterium]
MDKEAQISALVSEETRTLLERYVAKTGMKKGRVIEDALRIHLEALRELPSDVLVPARVVVTKSSGEKLMRRLEAPAKPNAALRKLLRDDD